MRSALRDLFVPTGDDCRTCRHFQPAPDVVEAALPGLAALASAHASTWGDSGLCVRHDRVTNGVRRCPAFTRHR